MSKEIIFQYGTTTHFWLPEWHKILPRKMFRTRPPGRHLLVHCNIQKTKFLLALTSLGSCPFWCEIKSGNFKAEVITRYSEWCHWLNKFSLYRLWKFFLNIYGVSRREIPVSFCEVWEICLLQAQRNDGCVAYGYVHGCSLMRFDHICMFPRLGIQLK